MIYNPQIQGSLLQSVGKQLFHNNITIMNFIDQSFRSDINKKKKHTKPIQ